MSRRFQAMHRHDPRSESESGVALITVLVVLMALVIIATPFSISMRNHNEAATDHLNRTRALKECEALRNIALENLKGTHPALDGSSPLFDDESEWALELDDLPLDFKTADPKGKIWSLRCSDQQGLVNLNGASIYLVANLLGMRTHLAETLEAGEPNLKVGSTEGFPPEGLLWIEGEGLLYTSTTEESFEDLDREMDLLNMEWNPRALHEAGTEILGYPAFLIATYCYKWLPGRISTFPTLESVRNIAVYGEQGLLRSTLDRLQDLVTVHSGYPAGRRFLNPQRIVQFGMEDALDTIIVENGRYMGPGSVVRIRLEDEIHYSLVIRAQPRDGRSWTLFLQDPVPFSLEGEETGVADVLARAAVNVNTAPVEVLESLVKGLSLTDLGVKWVRSFERAPEAGSEGTEGEASESSYLTRLIESTRLGAAGGGRRVGSKEARAVAEAIAQGTVGDFADLHNRLLALTEGENATLSTLQHWAIMLNAMNANDAFLEGGTAPFCFLSEGCFKVDTAVSDNYAASGREKARQFMSDVAWPAPSGPLLTLFTTQKDFEEQRRLTREGRHYITLPNNLNLPEPGNNPPSRAPLVMTGGAAPSGEIEGSGVQLAPVRMEGDRCLHFDRDDIPYFESRSVTLVPSDPDGGYASALSDSLGFRTGEQVLYLEPIEMPAAVLGGPYARVWPFSVEMWYRFDEVGDEHYLIDCGQEGREVNNRIYLFHDGKELVFRVSDVSVPTSTLNSDEPLEHAEIRYDFSDLPLEPGVFYHIACMAAGTKPSDLCLFVDGVPRGKRSFLTRLVQPMSTAANLSGVAGGRGTEETIQVADAESFPSRGVIRIGYELIEYTSRGKEEFTAESDEDDPFGGRGRRLSLPTEHPETEVVELYGYTCPLRSDTIPRGDLDLGDPMGPFWVAMIDPDDETIDRKEISAQAPSAEYDPERLGEGFYSDGNSVLPLVNVDGSPLSDEGEESFSEGGGYAIVFTELPFNRITFRGQDQEDRPEMYDLAAGDSWRPVSTTAHLINGYSVIRYTSFSGSSLEGVTWGSNGGYPKGLPKSYMKSEFEEEGGTPLGQLATETEGFMAPRCFVTRYDQGVFATEGEEDEIQEARVFVFPISIKASAGAGSLYESFFPNPNAEEPNSALVQVGLDFTGTGEDETEWIRYDSIEDDLFCRERPEKIRNTWSYLSNRERLDVNKNLKNDEVAESVNQQLLFRGQQGTRNGSHSAGSRVLPVFRVQQVPFLACPGRHDNITLVSYEEDTEPEGAVINHCNSWIYNDPEIGGGALIGLRSGVEGEYLRQDFDFSEIRQSVETGKDIGEALGTAWSIESRDVARIVKFPSGELPSKIPDALILGGNIVGAPSPSKGCMDEVRFKSFETPAPDLPKIARYALEQEMEEDEEDSFELFTNALRYNRHLLHADLLEPFEILKQLPEDSGFLLIGDEIVAYTDVDWEEGIITLAPDGRGCFGTHPGYHTKGEAVVLLNFPEASILEATLDNEDPYLFLQDAAGFPFEGAVLVGEEVIGYTRVEGNTLTMPDEEAPGFRRRAGLLRGRYGTTPGRHPAGSLVYRLPLRYRDLYMPDADPPEGAYFPLSLAAPGGYYSRVTWVEKLQGTGADLVVKARVGGRGDWSLAPAASKDIFFFEDPDSQEKRNALCRQGGRLDLRVFTRYRQGAFDPVDYTSNAWKYAPVLTTLGVEYVQPTRVVRHDEWR